MEIYEIVGRNLDITDAMRSYAEDKLSRLTRFFDQVVDAKVTMSYRQGRAEPATVEGQLNVPNGLIRAEENGDDTYAAVDLVVDKLERQLKRFKGRLDSEEHGGAPLLGVNAPMIKAHGSSEARGIKNALRQACTMIEGDVTGKIRDAVEKLAPAEEQ